jgi:hypothetical protein
LALPRDSALRKSVILRRVWRGTHYAETPGESATTEGPSAFGGVNGERDEEDVKTRTGRLRGGCLLVTGLGVALALPKVAHASDGGVTSSSPTISPELNTSRFQPGSDAGAPLHFENFGASTINYGDCANGIDLQISLDLSNVPAGDEIQVWAGTGSADCTQTSARTATASSTPSDFPGRCWPAAASNVFDATKATATGRLHVRDLVAYIGQQDPPTTYAPTSASSVCTPYATNSAVQLNIYFIFVPAGSDGSASPPAVTGVSGLYSTVAALVGPFAPQLISVPNTGITANSLVVYWEPQAQAIIAGYAIYAQDQGTTGLNTGVMVDASPTLRNGVQCHPALTCTPGDDAGGDDSSADDAGHDGGVADGGLKDGAITDGPAPTKDATLLDSGSGSGSCDAGLSDAWVAEDAAAYSGMSEAGLAALGCEYTAPVNAQAPPPTGGQTCVSGVLESLFQVDGGLGSIETTTSTIDSGIATTTDLDADTDGAVDGGTVVVATVDSGVASTTPGTVPETAGISVIPSRYLNFYDHTATDTNYTLTGLTTGHQYAITVAAVDSYGNIGPVGNLGCSTPTPVDDFYMAYTDDGGTAGGGYCALGAVGAPAFGSVFGFGIAGSAVALARRRRRARRKS